MAAADIGGIDIEQAGGRNAQGFGDRRQHDASSGRSGGHVEFGRELEREQGDVGQELMTEHDRATATVAQFGLLAMVGIGPLMRLAAGELPLRPSVGSVRPQAGQ